LAKGGEKAKLPKKLEKVCLWIDSVDFPIEKRKGMGKKHPYWSYKLNRPGRCFIVLRDATGQMCKVWGGFSPKFYDGAFIEQKHHTLDRKLAGAYVIADHHFASGQAFLKKVTIMTQHSKRSVTEVNPDGDPLELLNKEKQAFNEAHKKVRARVENIFGLVKLQFKRLTQPWSEDDMQQHNYAVITALGVINLKRQ
jgi:hypothetical protein